MKTFVCLFALVALSRASDEGLMTDIYGNTCPATGTGCSKDATDMQTCFAPSTLGCPETETCQASTDAAGNPVSCPIICASNELLCSPDPSKGPSSADYCIPSQFQSMAPGNVWCMASCDIPCAEGDDQCLDFDPSGCPITSCAAAGKCPEPTYDATGCPIDGSDPSCMCDPITQNVCQDPNNPDPSKSFCVNKGKGNGFTMAPTDCAADETPCPGPIGQDNCPTAGFCAKEASDCLTDWNGCPIIPPAKCADTDVSCTQPGSDGCMMESCIGAKDECTQDFDSNGCPIVESVECEVDQVNCPRGNGPDGCPQPDQCVPVDDSSLCPDVCDPPCDEMTEDMCSFFQNGCPYKMCVTKGTPCDMVGIN